MLKQAGEEQMEKNVPKGEIPACVSRKIAMLLLKKWKKEIKDEVLNEVKNSIEKVEKNKKRGV